MRALLRRLPLYAIVVLAAILAAQPVLHHHALDVESAGAPCSVCAFGADCAVAAPSLCAPEIVAQQRFETVDADVENAAPRRSPARAPPSA